MITIEQTKAEIYRYELAKQETLKLWKRLSEISSYYPFKESARDFKNEILEELGIGERMFGCPLCEVHNNTDHCPLGACTRNESCNILQSCFRTAYSDWQDDMNSNNHHNQKHATAFYEHLLRIFGE